MYHDLRGERALFPSGSGVSCTSVADKLPAHEIRRALGGDKARVSQGQGDETLDRLISTGGLPTV